MKTRFAGLLGLAFCPSLLSAADVHFQSGPAQTALVELYTSEGCSSCPPAETWLSRKKDDPGLWKKFVPLAFHVDYWDRLGWRDRFSSKEWTQRQSRYSSLWQSESVYTPAVVLNGRELRGWSNADLARPGDPAAAGILSATTTDGKTFAIEFKPASGQSAEWEVHLALLASDISSKIGAGENVGRNLKHDFVVLDLQGGEMKTNSGAEVARLTTAAKAEAGARLAVAIWVTPRGQLAPVQATGGWLL
ncbi:MAG: DUF1223 domain-containing protein [Chthoniobacterales bacterium]|nr:DUF1223 domain-containing protein [Chthoniobacterales bacterium]